MTREELEHIIRASADVTNLIREIFETTTEE